MTVINGRITIAQEAREYIEQGSGAISAAVPDRVLVYLARKYVEQLERASKRDAARRIEREVSENVRRTSAEVDGEVARNARRKAWAAVLGRSFALHDGTDVLWGDATLAQHASRADQQSKLADAARQDAQLHQEAASDIARYGVSCLAYL